jgi:hypothetical protein
MTRTWKLLCLTALLSALAVPAFLHANDPEKVKKPLTDAEKLDAILDQLSDLRTELKGDIRRAGQQADAKNRELDDRLRYLTERVEKLERALDRATTTPRTSFFQPAPVPAGGSATGTIQLQNMWTDMATVNLNGRFYNLQPGQTVTLANQPAGEYTYEVLANGYGTIRGPVTRTLDNNRTLTVFVYPMR